MRNYFFVAVIFLQALVISALLNSQGKAQPPVVLLHASAQDPTSFGSPPPATSAIQWNLSCADDSECEINVGALIRPNGVCTAFLVGRDLVATNLHCIPEDLWKEKAACANKILIIMPKTRGRPEERRWCKEIIHVSPPISEGSIRPDYAFLRVESDFFRPPISVSRRGIKDQEILTVRRMSPTKDGGVMNTIRCKAVQNSMMNPHFKNDFSPLVFMSQCPIVRGNSGSPILSIDGLALGVVSTAHEVKEGDKFGTGSNFACVEAGFLGLYANLPIQCKDNFSEQEIVKKNNELILSAQTSLEERFRKALEIEASTFNKRNSVEFAFQVMMRPATVLEQKQNVSQVAELLPQCYIQEKIRGLLGREVDFVMALKRWKIFSGRDKDRRIQTNLIEEVINYRITYKAQPDPKDSGILVSIQEEKSAHPAIKARVPVCQQLRQKVPAESAKVTPGNR